MLQGKAKVDMSFKLSNRHVLSVSDKFFVQKRFNTSKGHFWRVVHPIEKHSNSELCNNSWTLTFEQYIDGKLLPSAIYGCSCYEVDICIYKKSVI